MRLRRFRKLRRNRNYATMVLVAFVGILSVMGIGYSYLQQRLSMDISLSKKQDDSFREYFAYVIASKNISGNAEGLFTDDFGNIRYRGANDEVKNYVEFNDELWRVVGIFEGGYVKLVNDSTIGEMAWDSGGDNDWSTASLQNYLNTTYYNAFTEDSKSVVSLHTYRLGGITDNMIFPDEAYEFEQGSDVFPGNPTSIKQRVGLLYASDFGYAASERCNSDMSLYPGRDGCDTSGNWLYMEMQNYWFQTAASDNSTEASLHWRPGYLSVSSVNNQYLVRPVVYLQMNVVCNGGTGTSTDPYTLSSTLGPLTTDPINNPMNPQTTATTTGTGTGTGTPTGTTTGTGTPTGTTTGTWTPTGTTTPTGTWTPTGTTTSTPTTTTPIRTTSNSPVTTPNY